MRFEKVDGYNAIKDNENLVYTLAEHEAKVYHVGEFDIEDLLDLLNTLNSENKALKEQIKKLEEDK